jgi:RND family efflux transporter MFP subunit
MKTGGKTRSKRIWIAAVVSVVVIGGALAGLRARTRPPKIATVEVVRGEFVNYLQLRGEIKAAKSVVLSAPSIGSDPQIVRLVKNGAVVKKGDLLAQFDTTDLERQLQQRQTELKQAEAQIEQTRAQARIQEEQDQTDLAQAKFNVERARLDASKQEILSEIDGQKAKLALADAEQKLREAQQKLASDRAGAAADIDNQQQKRGKALFDVNRVKRQIASATLRAPLDGMVTLEDNWRFGSGGMAPPQWRQGDRAWAGAPIVTLPQLHGLRVEALIDESDRGLLKPGLPVTIRVDAVPDREFPGSLSDVSPLTKLDFSIWPPTQHFSIGVEVKASDSRLRPGMSASARIAVERIADSVVVPADTVFEKSGRSVVYALHGNAFEERAIQIARRNRERVAIASGIAPGEKIAAKDPTVAAAEAR